jgi:predicted nucleotidyltransferase
VPGTASRRAVTLEELRDHRDELTAIGKRHGVENIRVFGSVARGKADERSDLDLRVDPGRDASLFTLAAFALDVEALLDVFTQVATPAGLKLRIRDRVLAEAVPI